MEALALIGLVVAGLTAAAAAVASVLRTARAHVTITRLPADAPLPSPSLEPAETDEPGMHTFTFSHSGVIGKPTPEQKEVLERLRRGELTPQQAAEALGGTAHTFGTRIELGAGAQHERDDALEEALEPAVGPPLPPLRWLFGALALLIVIGGLMWLGGGTTTRDHLFTTAYTTALVGLLVAAFAGPSGLARVAPSGFAMARVAFEVALAAAAAVLGWGLAATATGHWSAFFIGVVFILIGSGVVAVLLLGRLAVDRTRSTIDLLKRRRS